jgi:hypothetical protein
VREQAGGRLGDRKHGRRAAAALAALVVFGFAAARCGSADPARQPPPPADDAGLPPRDVDASVPPVDGGPTDAGPADSGPADSGPADSGTPLDGGPDAGPADDGGTPDAGPAGPPTPTLIQPSRSDAQIISTPNGEALLAASADEGGNIWAVSSNTIYLLRAGTTSFESYGNPHGKTDDYAANDGIYTVAGGAAGEAWVGYKGLFQNGESDDPSVPLYIRQSGGTDHFVMTPNGIQLDRHVMFWTPAGILTAEPTGRWKVRSIFTIVYNHGQAPGTKGDVFFGGTHGTAMVHPDGTMEEHQHAGWNYCTTPDPNSCSLLAGDHHGLAIHPTTGNVWIGADFAAIFVGYLSKETIPPERKDVKPGTPINRRPGEYDTAFVLDPFAPWKMGFRTWYGRSADVDRPEWGGRDFTMGMDFDAYGDLWIAGYFNGIARARIAWDTGFTKATKLDDFDYWNHRFGKTPLWPADFDHGTTRDYVWTIAGDPDGSVWAGGPHGAYRFVAATDQWVSYAGLLPGQNVSRITLDPRPGVRAVYLATNGGLVIYRGK